MLAKFTEFKLILKKHCIDIVCITETHFTSEFIEAEISIPGYTAFRGDRAFKLDRTKSNTVDVSGGGGSVIYVHDNVPIKENSYHHGPDSVSVVIDTNVGSILIGCFYRSPSLNKDQVNEFHKFFKEKVEIKGDKEIEKVLLGDFNYSDISWVSGNVVAPVNSTNQHVKNQQSFLETVHDNGLSWLLTDQVTRRRMVKDKLQESLIDQVFVTEEALVTDFNIGPPLGNSDHVSICVQLNVFDPSKNSPGANTQKKNWSKLSSNDILEKSNHIDWNFSMDTCSMSVEEMASELYQKLDTITQSAPSFKLTKNNDDFYSSQWMNSSIKRAYRIKNKAWKEFDACPTGSNLNYALFKQAEFGKCEVEAN